MGKYEEIMEHLRKEAEELRKEGERQRPARPWQSGQGGDLEGLLSTAEAARILGVHPVSVQDMLRRGRLPGRKVGRTWVIPRDALLEFAKTYVKGPGCRKPKAQEGRQS